MAREWFREFEFDLPAALLHELTRLFAAMPAGPLNAATVSQIPEAQGVYQLFLDGQLVYVGKTDAEAGLNQRLDRHSHKILHRQGLDPRRVTFKAVRVFVFTAMDLEQQLIKHYEGLGSPLPWNNSGFGANDPGIKRDTTTLKAGHFDLLYPIDIDIPIEIDSAGGPVTVAFVLTALKQTLPYTLRFESAAPKSRKPHPDLVTALVTLSNSRDILRNILVQIKISLGPSWQITVLPGYVIMYKESKHYPHGFTL
ncbi:GIY-YIG nuclease family protein [Trinickia sp. YCB016]